MRFPGAYYLTVEDGANKIYVSCPTIAGSKKWVEFTAYTLGIEEVVWKLKTRGYIQGLSEQNCLDMLGFPENKRA